MASQYDALTRNRRFYKAVSTAPESGGFAVMLDGRTPKTPAGGRLVLPTQALADLVAAEWEAQVEFILPDEMGATRLANTVIDRIGAVHGEVAAEVAQYAGSDVLCYFAEHPRGLVEEEALRWGAVLDWAASALGIALKRSTGILHVEQDSASLAKVAALAAVLDDFALAALAHLTALLGSAILALAVQRGHLAAEEAFELSRLDEAFQARLWGEDSEAAERIARQRAEAVLMGRWFAALA